MAALVTSSKVENVVRTYLNERGYSVSRARTHGETGSDIEARKGGLCIFVEAIAFKSSPPARAKDFYEAFFRAVSRLHLDRCRIIIALPSRFGRGLPQRARAIGVAWQRIGDAFPELEIWLVDTDHERIKETKWNEWLPIRVAEDG